MLLLLLPALLLPVPLPLLSGVAAADAAAVSAATW